MSRTEITRCNLCGAERKAPGATPHVHMMGGHNHGSMQAAMQAPPPVDGWILVGANRIAEARPFEVPPLPPMASLRPKGLPALAKLIAPGDVEGVARVVAAAAEDQAAAVGMMEDYGRGLAAGMPSYPREQAATLDICPDCASNRGGDVWRLMLAELERPEEGTVQGSGAHLHVVDDDGDADGRPFARGSDLRAPGAGTTIDVPVLFFGESPILLIEMPGGPGLRSHGIVGEAKIPPYMNPAAIVGLRVRVQAHHTGPLTREELRGGEAASELLCTLLIERLGWGTADDAPDRDDRPHDLLYGTQSATPDPSDIDRSGMLTFERVIAGLRQNPEVQGGDRLCLEGAFRQELSTTRAIRATVSASLILSLRP